MEEIELENLTENSFVDLQQTLLRPRGWSVPLNQDSGYLSRSKLNEVSYFSSRSSETSLCSLADSQTDVGPIIATSIPEFKEVELYPKAIESLSTSCDMTSVKPVLVTVVYTARKLAGNPSDNAQQFRQADLRKSTAVDKVH